MHPTTSPITFLWHDYETFGISPRHDRPAQFAAIRTDAELNEIGAPINILCQPAPDYLPDPQSCLVTGIGPQQCLQHGLPEHAFARQIHDAFSQPGTIGVGYNSIRFDDEFTRFLLWRNLLDPYGREWQNGCGRWDLLDVMRLAHALRPEHFEWPLGEDGQVSFRLEHLAAANGVVHDRAHDALSDVRATLGLARLLRQRQPRLFDFALALRHKQRVMDELGLPALAGHAQPFLHVSGMFPVEQGCLSVMLPLAIHPSRRNEVICWNLRHSPRELASLTADDIRTRLFSTSDALAASGHSRIALKTVHINKSPMVVRNLRTLRDEQASHWGIDWATIRTHLDEARQLPDLTALWSQVYAATEPADTAADVDSALYGAFTSNSDRQKLQRISQLPPAELARSHVQFEDGRLAELVWRYRARNFSATLSEDEAGQWRDHCASRLFDGAGGARTIDDYLAALDEAASSVPADDDSAQQLLAELHEYAESVAAQVEGN